MDCNFLIMIYQTYKMADVYESDADSIVHVACGPECLFSYKNIERF